MSLKREEFYEKTIDGEKSVRARYSGLGYLVDVTLLYGVLSINFIPIGRILQPNILYKGGEFILDFGKGNLFYDDFDEFCKNLENVKILIEYVKNNIDNLIEGKAEL